MDSRIASHHVSRLEIVETGRRRRWSASEKLRIVEESYSAPRQGSATARRHGISNQLLNLWRKAARERVCASACRAGGDLRYRPSRGWGEPHGGGKRERAACHFRSRC